MELNKSKKCTPAIVVDKAHAAALASRSCISLSGVRVVLTCTEQLRCLGYPRWVSQDT